MTPDDLRSELAIEFASLDLTLNELTSLQTDLGGREPTLREKAAAAAFLAQLYSGIENVLKRINRYYGLALPAGESWHVELFVWIGPEWLRVWKVLKALSGNSRSARINFLHN